MTNFYREINFEGDSDCHHDNEYCIEEGVSVKSL